MMKTVVGDMNMRDGQFRITRRGFLGTTALAGMSLYRVRPHLFAADADSDTGLRVHTDVPRNSEPPLDRLIQSWMTPTELFYVRSHAPVPEIDADNYRLSVEGLVHEPLSLSLAELQRMFKPATTTVTLTCAGNRRIEHNAVKPVKGVPWEAGAIGNAKWAGVRLSEVLKKAGVQEGARHVWFDGLDQVEHGDSMIPFGGSIPIEKAFADTDAAPGTLLATQMNDRPLTGHHGFPLRTVVPGYIGARSVKWLGKIVVSDRPSPNHYVADAYKLVDEDSSLQLAEQAPIYKFPINSVICQPSAGAKFKAGRMTVSGYALPSGHSDATVARVEVSTDGGQSWQQVRFTSDARPLTWRLWTVDVAVTPATKSLTVRATDSRGHQQPNVVQWNLKGYMYNAWHNIPVNVQS